MADGGTNASAVLGRAKAAIVADPWLDDLAALIAVDTSFPPGAGYEAMARALEPRVAALGFRTRRVSIPGEKWSVPGGQAHGERINLIAERRTGRPVCSLYYHIDVVPPGAGWTKPPFALTVEGDVLYGRGTADMKGTIAATFAALRAAAALDVPLRYDPTLLFCTDEEGGLYPGVRYLAESGMIEGHVLCLNGGAAPRIWQGCFGSLDFAIRVVGRAAHSGNVGGAGINAIDEALPILEALRVLKAKVENRTSHLVAPPAFGGAPLRARLNVTAIEAGAKGSAIPGECRLLVNRRYAPEEDGDAVLRELETAVRDAAAGGKALAIETQVVGHLVPVDSPDGGPYWPRWIDALAHGFGWRKDQFARYGASSSSDMGFVQKAGIRDILLGGLSRPSANVHAADEHTTRADVQALALALFAYLTDLAPPAQGERP